MRGFVLWDNMTGPQATGTPMKVFALLTRLFGLLALCCLPPLEGVTWPQSVSFGQSEMSSSLFNSHRIKGRIVGNRYYGYENGFSFDVPSALDLGQVDDYYLSPYIGGVAFHNDYGFFLKLEIDELVPEVVALITQHPQIKEEILDALFVDLVIPQLKSSVPKLNVLDMKPLVLPNNEPAIFAVINYPELSTKVNPLTGHSLDIKRGYLFFFAGDKSMVSISLQDSLTLIPTVAEAAKERLSERLLNHLLRYQSTFRIDH